MKIWHILVYYYLKSQPNWDTPLMFCGSLTLGCLIYKIKWVGKLRQFSENHIKLDKWTDFLKMHLSFWTGGSFFLKKRKWTNIGIKLQETFISWRYDFLCLTEAHRQNKLSKFKFIYKVPSNQTTLAIVILVLRLNTWLLFLHMAINSTVIIILR